MLSPRRDRLDDTKETRGQQMMKVEHRAREHAEILYLLTRLNELYHDQVGQLGEIDEDLVAKLKTAVHDKIKQRHVEAEGKIFNATLGKVGA